MLQNPTRAADLQQAGAQLVVADFDKPDTLAGALAGVLMAFITMYYWLFKGMATSIFENRIYSLACFNTAAGLLFVVLR